MHRRFDARPRATGLVTLLLVAGCSTLPEPVGGSARTPLPAPVIPPIAAPALAPRTPTPSPAPSAAVQTGIASWYGKPFHGRRTASGEVFNMHAMTAAHRTMPLPTWARVRNPANGREIVVRINDRGPYKPGRIIDLSYAAAKRLGIDGIAPVQVERLPAADAKRLIAAAD
jgi:rare lipoprotein A